MSMDTRQRFGWVRISSDPRSPIGFCNANRQIGCYENDTDDSESDGSLPGATMARFHDASDTANELRPDTHSTDRVTGAKGTPGAERVLILLIQRRVRCLTPLCYQTTRLRALPMAQLRKNAALNHGWSETRSLRKPHEIINYRTR